MRTLTTALSSLIGAGVVLGACIDSPPGGPPTEADVAALPPLPDDVPDGTFGWARLQTPHGIELVPYTARNNHAIYDQDVDLGPISQVDARFRGGALTSSGVRWTSDTMRYAFHPQFDNEAIRNSVRSHIAELAEILPITFLEVPYASAGALPFVEFKWGSSGAWYGGLTIGVGQRGCGQTCNTLGDCRNDCGQWIYFNPDNNDPSASTVKHEVLHALGLWHEQSRTDRDSYIAMHPECISGNADQLGIKNDSKDLGPYDYNSIMHYSSSALCVPNAANNNDDYLTGCACLTMTVQTPNGTPVDLDADNKPDRIWQWDEQDLSPLDVNTMWRAYNKALGTDAAGDMFGKTLAVGDFNGDGFDDVAVGAPYEDRVANGITTLNTGAVYVFRGTSHRLVPWRVLTQANVPGEDFATGDAFGVALAAGDIDGDNKDELLVGAPMEDSAAVQNTGVVHVFAGTRGGPVFDHDITQVSAGGTVEAEDRFGMSIAIGKLSASATAEVAIGAPGDRITTRTGTARAGAVYVVHEEAGQLFIHKPTRLALGAGADGDNFGQTVAIGAIDAGGNADLIIGAPGTSSDAGAIHVYAGRTPPPEEMTYEWSAMATYRQTLVPPAATANGRFGESLLVADVLGNASPDVTVGAPGMVNAAGRVFVYQLVKANLQQTAPMALNQTLIAPSAASNDEFGFALAAIDRDPSTVQLDLVVGVPGRNSDAGSILLYKGGAVTIQLYTELQQSALINQTSEAGDRFGSTLGSGQLDGYGDDGSSLDRLYPAQFQTDLVIGSPMENNSLPPFIQVPTAGAIGVLLGNPIGPMIGHRTYTQQTELAD